MASGFERKNPLGAIRAFRRAFTSGEPVRLAVKVSRGEVNPPAFVRHAQPWQLDGWRRQDIIMAIGATDPAIDDNRAMSGALWGRGVGNALRVWDGWAHDWPWWERMIRLYLRGHD